MPGELKEELSAMLSGDFDDSTSAPGTEAPGTEAPSTEAPDDLETVAPATAAPDDDDDEVEILKQQVAALQKALAANVTQPKKQEPQQVADPQIEEVNFMDGIEMEDIQEDPKVLNALLNKVLKQGVKLGRESVLKDIPLIVTNNVRQQTVLKDATDKFYADNKDLVPWKKVVGQIAEELMSEDPSLTLDKLFESAAVEARKRLALVKTATQQPAKRPPAHPRKQRGGKTSPDTHKLTPMEEDVASMLKGV